MHHVFFTSLAEDLSMRDEWNGASREELLRSAIALYENEEDRVYDTIDFYLKKCSKFYLSQMQTSETIGNTFEVYASYGEKYLHIINQFDFPDYIKLVHRGPSFSTTKEETPHSPYQFRCDFLFSEEFKDKYTGQSVSVTRIDADDILNYRTFHEISRNINSFFDFPYFFILYKRYRQFERLTGKYTVPLWHHSPGFATICFPKLDNHIYNHRHGDASELRMWPHESLHGRMHCEADYVGALQTIGSNIGNWLRGEGSGPSQYDNADIWKYGGYEEEGYNPSMDGFDDPSGWKPVKGKPWE